MRLEPPRWTQRVYFKKDAKSMILSFFRRATESEPTDASSPAPVGDIRELLVYGTAWCGDCHRSRRFLAQNHIPYRWIDVDADPAAAQRILAINRGRRSVPTIIFPDGSTLTEPSNSELGRKLGLAH